MKNDIIGRNGFGDLTHIPDDQVALCKDWIKEYITPLKALNKARSSYNLKHQVEDACGTYISNGAYIKAAIELGYKYERTREESKNAYLNYRLQK